MKFSGLTITYMPFFLILFKCLYCNLFGIKHECLIVLLIFFFDSSGAVLGKVHRYIWSVCCICFIGTRQECNLQYIAIMWNDSGARILFIILPGCN